MTVITPWPSALKDSPYPHRTVTRSPTFMSLSSAHNLRNSVGVMMIVLSVPSRWRRGRRRFCKNDRPYIVLDHHPFPQAIPNTSISIHSLELSPTSIEMKQNHPYVESHTWIIPSPSSSYPTRIPSPKSPLVKVGSPIYSNFLVLVIVFLHSSNSDALVSTCPPARS